MEKSQSLLESVNKKISNLGLAPLYFALACCCLLNFGSFYYTHRCRVNIRYVDQEKTMLALSKKAEDATRNRLKVMIEQIEFDVKEVKSSQAKLANLKGALRRVENKKIQQLQTKIKKNFTELQKKADNLRKEAMQEEAKALKNSLNELRKELGVHMILFSDEGFSDPNFNVTDQLLKKFSPKVEDKKSKI